MERIPAGNVTFYVETRWAGVNGGPSIQVRAGVDDKEVSLLRFDCFVKVPHYHYDPDGRNEHREIDTVLSGDSLPWVLTQIRERLPQMVAHAGHPDVASLVDAAAVDGALDKVAAYFKEHPIPSPA
jgi:hypothetical protein